MKQHITEEQLKELDIDKQNKLREWWDVKTGDIGMSLKTGKWELVGSSINQVTASLYYAPLLSIGQMIELLGRSYQINSSATQWLVRDMGDIGCAKNELCDALWEEVKKKLGQ